MKPSYLIRLVRLTRLPEFLLTSALILSFVLTLSACGRGQDSMMAQGAPTKAPSTPQSSPSGSPTPSLGPNLTQYPAICEFLASLISSAEEGDEIMNAQVLSDGTCLINGSKFAPGTTLSPSANSGNENSVKQADDTSLYILKDATGHILETFYVIDSQVIMTLLYGEPLSNPAPSPSPTNTKAAPQILLTRQIHFDAGQSQVLKTQQRALDLMTQAILDLIQDQSLPVKSIEVQGYTDDAGAESLNLHLSQLRAEAVRSQLLSRLKDSPQGSDEFWEPLIRARGYGSEDPLSGPSGRDRNGQPVFTKKDRALNRRVELHFDYYL